MNLHETGPKLAYNIPELVKATGIGRNRIYQEIKLGRLKLTKIGRRSVVVHDHATEWLRRLGEAA